MAEGLHQIQLPTRELGGLGPLSPQTPGTPLASSSLRGAANTLPSKVSSVLSTSYADSDFREALALVDERKVQNTAETRRRLRLDLQKEVIDSNGEIIREFGKVAEQLRRIGHTVEKLNKSYGEMKAQIEAANQATSPILQEASYLVTQRRQVETKQQLLKAFRAHFVMTEDEISVLTMTSEPVDDRFFTLLAKCKKISKDSEVLLGIENQTLGLEIIEQASKNLNLAFQKLYRWIQRELKTLNLENPQIGSSIRRGLRVMAERPSLFQNCLDFFAEAREQVLSDAFYTALTGNAVGNAPRSTVKPIELAAHDPLRYVGDMAAWVHSAAVSERESLEVLFISDGNEIARGIQAGRETEVWRLVNDDSSEESPFNAVQALNELVDRDMAGAARLLRQRVEQVIQINEEIILSYKLANLLSFYRATFNKLLGRESGLVEALGSLEVEALRQFRSLMRDHIATIQGDFQHAPADLSIPDFLQDALEQLTSILRTYETSLTPSTDREAEFQPILAEAFDPFVAGCENMARNMPSPADSIFAINCDIAARSVLAPYEFTERRLDDLERRIKEERQKLADSQYRFFRTASGLDALIRAVAGLSSDKDGLERIHELPETQEEALAGAAQALDDFLPSALMDAMEHLRHLQDARLAREITEAAAERFCEDFEQVEEALLSADERSDENGELEEGGSLRALFPRTSGEIRVLLS